MNRHGHAWVVAVIRIALLALLALVGVWRWQATNTGPEVSAVPILVPAMPFPVPSDTPQAAPPSADAPTSPPVTPVAMRHPPVPDSWLTEHRQDLLAANVFEKDTDADGFTTLEEFLAGSDPADAASHPPFWTKLFLKRFVRVPFRLRFHTRSGPNYLVDDSDDAPTRFTKVGEIVTFGRHRYKVTKYTEKYDTSQRFKKDVSELTLTDLDTGQTVILPKGVDVDSPTTYAVLDYAWMGLTEFAVQRDREFTLAPESNVKYKVVELSDTEIKILKKDDNTTISVRAQPAGKQP